MLKRFPSSRSNFKPKFSILVWKSRILIPTSILWLLKSWHLIHGNRPFFQLLLTSNINNQFQILYYRCCYFQKKLDHFPHLIAIDYNNWDSSVWVMNIWRFIAHHFVPMLWGIFTTFASHIIVQWTWAFLISLCLKLKSAVNLFRKKIKFFDWK